MATNNSQISPKYACEICNLKTNNKKDYSNHILTRKHQKNDKPQQITKDATEISQLNKCNNCGKEYESRSGLWRHEKKCVKETEPTIPPKEHSESDIKILTNLVLEVVKSNADLQKQMVDVCKNSNNTNNSHNNNNSHNKTFNLQFFLNEQCKDAMNIMDFVDTFKLQFSDLERIGEVGYVEGISNIVIDKLNEMDVYKRPIHCSDAKREIMYVKDKDVWEKENATNDKIRLALKHITKKNSDMIRPWANAHPGVLNGDHRLSDKYQEMIIEAMGGNKNKTMKEGEDKIIKKISKMVLIDKKDLNKLCMI